jgi:hypothetical protein
MNHADVPQNSLSLLGSICTSRLANGNHGAIGHAERAQPAEYAGVAPAGAAINEDTVVAGVASHRGVPGS